MKGKPLIFLDDIENLFQLQSLLPDQGYLGRSDIN
jgi:hypothetical protein